MIKRLSHVNIYVLDIEKAKRVYTEILGFEVHTEQKMDNGFHWLTVSTKGNPEQEIVLHEIKEGETTDSEGIRHVLALLEKNAMAAGVWEVDDAFATYEDLKAKGIEFVSPPQQQFYGIEAIFQDGCGNWFSMTQPK